ncbi:hypothetical protein BRARA_B02538 [Brassica rapa]|uniref:Uncharacterized protein n=1 Tax=Brassica campestris TaxID=3711 RepID=A0A398ADD4_BRACM|nr:NEDD8-activating enzyme E1 regulatory subunit AXR1-like isoform X1 [Brassica rapa]XP_009108383.1 NEDD8-activating enzyme E1 regulatory subunit AXR1-like isoform X1 [Brassica rapa]XP_018509015.1 NEDD8-activating enzyme E1 regulatory subunit AXR1-like isoform X1 [Brassica rapa]XP_033133286.1 NEDD8-activating enzyme E1 regulatory subunit AXR1-like isoform X1 [Brassica rapa]RID75495.1 hypothetical protein BRARA_B02538 [Brassica rapa]RID75496.1 hypothetical protein BRARA_B02538 [Brassica rapa]R
MAGYDSVKAKFIEESPDTLIMTSPSFFSQFTLVIATQLVGDSMVKLDRICREANVKLVFVRSYGLAGIVRVSVKEHTIIDSKPDHFLDDLRLNNHGVSQTCHRGRSIVDYSFVILCCLV